MTVGIPDFWECWVTRPRCKSDLTKRSLLELACSRCWVCPDHHLNFSIPGTPCNLCILASIQFHQLYHCFVHFHRYLHHSVLPQACNINNPSLNFYPRLFTLPPGRLRIPLVIGGNRLWDISDRMAQVGRTSYQKPSQVAILPGWPVPNGHLSWDKWPRIDSRLGLLP